MDLQGKAFVVTGGASGIGRALTIELMKRGASVASADRDTEGLKETKSLAESASHTNTRCTTHHLDVSNLEEWRTFRDDVIKEHGSIDGIINNAGVAMSVSVEEMSYEQLDWMMSINFNGMVYGTKEFLPHLKQRPEAIIANVSSVFGLFSVNSQSAYCASKFAIRGFTNALEQELQDTPVAVCSIHPGHIGTNIVLSTKESGTLDDSEETEAELARAAKAFKDEGLDPARAAEIIIDGLQKRKRKICVGRDAIWFDRLNRWFPEWFVDFINRTIEKRFAQSQAVAN